MVTLINPTSLSHSRSQPLYRLTDPLDMKRVGTIILGGGQGTRLFPLTMWRCKPAMNFGGRYRLIDVSISNSINSGCYKIYIITQFLATSLHQHIFKTYRLDSGFIEVLPAEEKPQHKNWFQGTADAVRQNLEYFFETPVDYFLILSGDQLYNLDFQKMLLFAKETDADLVIASLPVSESNVRRMGTLKIDDQESITDFHEKPQDAFTLEQLRLCPSQVQKLGINPEKKLDYLGSMGIYLFKREALFELLASDLREDFGKHLIPTKVSQGSVAAYIHQGYWEDIGTIESFYQANMALTHSEPLFNCYNEKTPLYTSPSHLPGAKISKTQVNNAIICEGSFVEADEVSHSILGPRTNVHRGSVIRDSYIIGNDYYSPPVRTMRLPEKFQIGEDCLIRNAIIDKHVSIGKGVQLINKNKLTHYDGDNIYIRDEIIIVARGATIPDGYVL